MVIDHYAQLPFYLPSSNKNSYFYLAVSNRNHFFHAISTINANRIGCVA